MTAVPRYTSRPAGSVVIRSQGCGACRMFRTRPRPPHPAIVANTVTTAAVAIRRGEPVRRKVSASRTSAVTVASPHATCCATISAASADGAGAPRQGRRDDRGGGRGGARRAAGGAARPKRVPARHHRRHPGGQQGGGAPALARGQLVLVERRDLGDRTEIAHGEPGGAPGV